MRRRVRDTPPSPPPVPGWLQVEPGRTTWSRGPRRRARIGGVPATRRALSFPPGRKPATGCWTMVAGRPGRRAGPTEPPRPAGARGRCPTKPEPERPGSAEAAPPGRWPTRSSCALGAARWRGRTGGGGLAAEAISRQASASRSGLSDAGAGGGETAPEAERRDAVRGGSGRDRSGPRPEHHRRPPPVSGGLEPGQRHQRPSTGEKPPQSTRATRPRTSLRERPVPTDHGPRRAPSPAPPSPTWYLSSPLHARPPRRKPGGARYRPAGRP